MELMLLKGVASWTLASPFSRATSHAAISFLSRTQQRSAASRQDDWLSHRIRVPRPSRQGLPLSRLAASDGGVACLCLFGGFMWRVLLRRVAREQTGGDIGEPQDTLGASRSAPSRETGGLFLTRVTVTGRAQRKRRRGTGEEEGESKLFINHSRMTIHYTRWGVEGGRCSKGGREGDDAAMVAEGMYKTEDEDATRQHLTHSRIPSSSVHFPLRHRSARDPAHTADGGGIGAPVSDCFSQRRG